MAIRVDWRTIRFERDDEALHEVEVRRAGWLEQELGLARLFSRIDRKAAYVPASCGSVQELASRRGYDAPRARDLAQLGYALEAEPALEELLRANQIGFAAAMALGRIYREPELLGPKDEWVRWARFERFVDLERRIRRRVESVRQGRPADIPWSAHVTGRTAENLARCRQLASRKAGVMLTNGQLLDVISLSYLLEHDEYGQVQHEPAGSEPAESEPAESKPAESKPAESKPAESKPAENGQGENRQGESKDAESGRASPACGTPQPGTRRRRLPPTEERPHDRTIPAEVVRALEARSGGLCEFGSCERVAMESCHLVPHRDGSGRELKDLVRGCRLHHKLFDAERIKFLGWTESTDPLGCDLPVFLAVETNEILRPKARPGGSPGSKAGPAADRDGPEHPPWLLRSLGARLRGRLERSLHAPGPDVDADARGPADGTAKAPNDGHAEAPNDGDARAAEDGHAKGTTDEPARATEDEPAKAPNDGNARATEDGHAKGARDEPVDRDALAMRSPKPGSAAEPGPTAEPASAQPACPEPACPEPASPEAGCPEADGASSQEPTRRIPRPSPGERDRGARPEQDRTSHPPLRGPQEGLPRDPSQRAPPSAQGP